MCIPPRCRNMNDLRRWQVSTAPALIFLYMIYCNSCHSCTAGDCSIPSYLWSMHSYRWLYWSVHFKRKPVKSFQISEVFLRLSFFSITHIPNQALYVMEWQKSQLSKRTIYSILGNAVVHGEQQEYQSINSNYTQQVQLHVFWYYSQPNWKKDSAHINENTPRLISNRLSRLYWLYWPEFH